MKYILKLYVLLSLFTPVVSSASSCVGSDCLICEELSSEEHYKEGIMKAMRFIAPGKDTWLFRSDFDLSNNFGIEERFESDLARFVESLRANGTELVIVVQPTRGLMNAHRVREEYRYGFDFEKARHSFTKLLNQLERSGAHVPDVMALVDQPMGEDYFFRRDHHWTPFGSKLTAQIAATYIKNLPVYSELEEKEYVTEESTYLPKDGTMNRALRRICGNNFGMQYVQGFQTVPVNSGEDALFGDVSDPQVVLVGTSNSAERDDDYKNYNFSGFLKEYLKVDILNYAMPGAGDIGALIQYFQSEDFDVSNPPKLIIWELPASYQLSDEKIYRQLIPAVQGGCDAGVTKKENTLDLKALMAGQRVEVLSNSGRTKIDFRNRDGFLELNFDDKNIKDFYVITYYDNGERDKIWFRRPAIVDGGRYLLELSKDPRFADANLLSVFIEPSETISNDFNLRVRLCQ